MVADPYQAPVRRGALALPSLRLGASPLAGALATLSATAALVLLSSAALATNLATGWPLLPAALFLFLPIGFLVLRFLDAHPHSRFGPANVVTVLRGGMAALIGAFVWESEHLDGSGGEPLLWGLAAATVIALSLDGLDGWLARRTGLASSFGERFDMETDAYLILVLCALAYASEKAGAFVMLIGLMRYGFCLWAAADARLRRPLGPSLRRKTVCVLQIALLCLVLLPAVSPDISNALAAVALAMLAWSFAVDVAALLRRPA
ncbi:CDP-alcohol phosphatidyltransferase family protein [Aureimonas jatrophae]|uniref:Phosphatidylglycerophosphate synthase n=1 Tax=Aureimonas jatrophae TaxID=1166073 RepID=A0A1H0FGB3_9HYPH|nr:CDP-alcohol phosphatidyltransferase family protein [Aureimonas jatrophae]MBB3950032.1 phosphatidylglycerophosphate synthase [Aureimonas jatrophae]SDN93624.1 Phosphatidylglycerophosphate synthase [Aureimonas jatrophae]